MGLKVEYLTRTFNPYYWYLRPEWLVGRWPQRCRCTPGITSYGLKWLWFGAFVAIPHEHWLGRLLRLEKKAHTWWASLPRDRRY